MRISTSWLGEFVETPAPEKLNHIFEMAGIGVENYDAERDVWTLEITSNRGDWLSAIGLAREIAEALVVELGPRGADDLELGGEQFIGVERAERGKQHALGKVAGRAEEEKAIGREAHS